MKNRMVTGTAMALLLSVAPLDAQQSPWSLEFRGGASVPTSELEGADLGTGIGFEGNVGYRFFEHMSVYAGWDWTFFNLDESFAGSDMDFEETGYVFGLRWEHPFQGEAGQGLAGWIRAGGSYKHIEVEDDEGEMVDDSGHGLGWEVGAGLSIPLGGSWRLTPGVRYKSLSRDLSVESATADWDVSDFSFEVGGRWHF
jgi:opacity protein-like surface antigen